MGFPGGSDGKESAWGQWQRTYLPMQEIQEKQVQSLGGREDPLEKENFCLENPMDRGPWQATVHRVTKSRTQLSIHTRVCIYTHIYICLCISYLHLSTHTHTHTHTRISGASEGIQHGSTTEFVQN